MENLLDDQERNIRERISQIHNILESKKLELDQNYQGSKQQLQTRLDSYHSNNSNNNEDASQTIEGEITSLIQKLQTLNRKIDSEIVDEYLYLIIPPQDSGCGKAIRTFSDGTFEFE